MKKAVAILTLLAMGAPVFAADAASAASLTSGPPSVAFSALRMIGALCLVFSLLFAGVWGFRNAGRFSPNKNAKLKVLESRSLGHRHSIFVVAYDQQRLLLSSSPTGVTMLTHLPEASLDEVEPEPAPAPAPASLSLPNFSTAFLQALASRRK